MIRKILFWSPVITTFFYSVLLFYMSFRIARVEQNTSNQIGSFMQRISPILNFPDTVRRIIAPPLRSINEFHFFEGKTTKSSQKFLDVFDYTPKIPKEVYDGYITEVESNAGAGYFVWSQLKIDRRGTKISGWFLSAGGVFELGYHANKKDKIYAPMLFPVVHADGNDRHL